MNALQAVRWCLTAALAGAAAVPRPACARDTSSANAAAAATASAPALDLLPPTLRPTPADASQVIASQPQERPAGGATASADEALESAAGLASSRASKPQGGCREGCKPRGGLKQITLLPEVLLRDLGEVPIVGDVLITPVTHGITLAPVDGLPEVTFKVKPTKFARGDGLVVISRF